MVALQCISKILQTKSLAIYEDNMLTPDYFVGYEDQINFILTHYEQYGNVPDKETFLAHFTDANGNCSIELVEVQESDKYLVDTLREEYLYYRSVPVLQKMAELLKTDSNAAAEYMAQQVSVLQPSYNIGGVDIISQASQRLSEYKERKQHQDTWFFESGFKELDEITHGIQRGEELLVIVARTNQGKSWILEKMCTHVWKTGFNVGYVSPEMSASSIGFRFDTLFNNFSNKSLMWGKEDTNDEDYSKYIDELSSKQNKFMVATPLDFNRKITISKLRNWVKQNKLDLIAIDGITYLSDERGHKNDNKTTTLTNISEDLMGLSMELKIPILVVVQANRGGVAQDTEGTPELETIRDSDGIAFNASKVLSIRQKQDNVLEIGIKKQRNGQVGGKLNYQWAIDTGTFVYLPSYETTQSKPKVDKQVSQSRKQYKDKTDIF